MVDRTIPWADDGTTPNYFTGEGGSDPPDGNFVVAETDAGTKLLEWDDTASEWVVRGDVNASGQSMEIDTLNATAVSTESLVIGGDIYTLDGTIDANTDYTYSMSTNSGEIIVLLDNGQLGFGIDQLQVNGDTGSNYQTIDSSDTETLSTEFSLDSDLAKYRGFALYRRRGVDLRFELLGGPGETSEDVGGRNANISSDITQFTIKQSGGNSRAIKARVYRRSMNV